MLPVKILTIVIIVPLDNALHAYKPLLPAVKTGQPRFVFLVIERSFSHFATKIDTIIDKRFNIPGIIETETERKKIIVSALDKVACLLGNTRSVCKKYYVHPLILQLYETQSLKKYLKQLDQIEKSDNKAALTHEEEVVLTLLENERM